MKYEFDSEIKQLEGKIKWNVFYFPYSVTEVFGTNSRVPVLINVDGYDFEHMLLPSRNGHYLVYNEFIKRAVKKEIGDTVHVILQKDDKERILAIPKYIEDALQRASVMEKYMNQPDYLRREQVNSIEIAKKEETKLNRLNKLLNMLANKE